MGNHGWRRSRPRRKHNQEEHKQRHEVEDDDASVTVAVTAIHGGRRAQEMLLGWLKDVVNDKPNPTREVELWRLRKGERQLKCVAVYLAIGIDVRLMEGDGFKRTQLLRDAPALRALSQEWQAKLLENAWGAS